MKNFISTLLCFLTCLSFFKVKCLESFDDTLTCKKKECVLFSSIMDSLINPSVTPCTNFFDFACGKFVKSTIVHDRYGEQGFTTALTEKAEENIRKLLDSPVQLDEIRPFKLAKKTFKMCVNHDQLDIDGDKPLKDLIARLGSWNLISKGLNIPERSWVQLYQNNLAEGFIADTFMSIYLSTDPKNNTKYIVKISPPSVEDFNRGYYDLLPKGRNNSLVNAYYNYMVEYTQLVGAEPEDAEREMLDVLELEQKMFDIKKREDPAGKPSPKVMKLAELQGKFPFIQWKSFIEIYLGGGFSLQEDANVIFLDEFYFENLVKLVENTPTRVFENYFFWRVIDYSKFYLSVKIKKPALKFHEIIYGRQTLEQQWKRCVSQLKNLLGLAITTMTARSETKQNRQDINHIIETVKHHVIERMKTIPMNSTMNKNLIKKIDSIELFVGYSDELFRDQPLIDFYRDLEIYEGEFFRTAMTLEKFSMTTYGRQILKPISETRWESFPAKSFQKSFYSSIERTIFIHANDLKSPVYNADLPSYVNYARLGWQVANLYAIAISFELDNKNISWYDESNQHLKNQYQDYVTRTYNMTVDGSKALRNNFADFLSYEFVYKAFRFEIDNLTEKPSRLPGLAYSLEQFFWISAMQRYCHVNKDQETLQKLILSIFPIESFRANNPLYNNFNFAKDFQCIMKDDGIQKIYPKSFPANKNERIQFSILMLAYTFVSVLF